MIGMSENEFWEITVGEANRRIEAFNKRYTLELKDLATMQYSQASLIVAGVANVFSGEGKFPTIEETYPTLFENERLQNEQQIKEQAMAANFLNYAAQHNLKFKQNKEVK